MSVQITSITTRPSTDIDWPSAAALGYPNQTLADSEHYQSSTAVLSDDELMLTRVILYSDKFDLLEFNRRSNRSAAVTAIKNYSIAMGITQKTTIEVV